MRAHDRRIKRRMWRKHHQAHPFTLSESAIEVTFNHRLVEEIKLASFHFSFHSKHKLPHGIHCSRGQASFTG